MKPQRIIKIQGMLTAFSTLFTLTSNISFSSIKMKTSSNSRNTWAVPLKFSSSLWVRTSLSKTRLTWTWLMSSCKLDSTHQPFLYTESFILIRSLWRLIMTWSIHSSWWRSQTNQMWPLLWDKCSISHLDSFFSKNFLTDITNSSLNSALKTTRSRTD